MFGNESHNVIYVFDSEGEDCDLWDLLHAHAYILVFVFHSANNETISVGTDEALPVIPYCGFGLPKKGNIVQRQQRSALSNICAGGEKVVVWSHLAGEHCWNKSSSSAGGGWLWGGGQPQPSQSSSAQPSPALLVAVSLLHLCPLVHCCVIQSGMSPLHEASTEGQGAARG